MVAYGIADECRHAMFQMLVSLTAFYVALKMGWDVLGPVVISYSGTIYVVTALYFLAWWGGRRAGLRHFNGAAGNSRERRVYLWLRDSSLMVALMAYVGLGFLTGGVYLLATHHAFIALLFAVLSLGLFGSIFEIGSEERKRRKGRGYEGNA